MDVILDRGSTPLTSTERSPVQKCAGLFCIRSFFPLLSYIK